MSNFIAVVIGTIIYWTAATAIAWRYRAELWRELIKEGER